MLCKVEYVKVCYGDLLQDAEVHSDAILWSLLRPAKHRRWDLKGAKCHIDKAGTPVLELANGQKHDIGSLLQEGRERSMWGFDNGAECFYVMLRDGKFRFETATLCPWIGPHADYSDIAKYLVRWRWFETQIRKTTKI